MIKDNISRVKEGISSVCARIGRNPASITIVAVSKGRVAREIEEALGAGITDIGENKVQEALIKYKELWPTRELANSRTISWHMVGHLQTNKVREAVKIFDLIHSVDSVRLAQEIDRQAAKINKVQDILLEIKTSPEATKSGLNPEEAAGAIKKIAQFKNINIKGLMTIAPLVDDPQKARSYFRMLREIRDKINERNEPNGLNELNVLSMGMTDDFKVAVEESSTMVRLGRAIFETV
ncbi:YggS family pyridoxal phosphate-dependent enzyme [bacterium]|nr:MAG: YggS family pyridoxal phosphate-dependent enzyme [bacterium]